MRDVLEFWIQLHCHPEIEISFKSIPKILMSKGFIHFIGPLCIYIYIYTHIYWIEQAYHPIHWRAAVCECVNISGSLATIISIICYLYHKFMTYLIGWLLCWVARLSDGCISVYIYLCLGIQNLQIYVL